MRIRLKVPSALMACPALMPSPIPRANSLRGLRGAQYPTQPGGPPSLWCDAVAMHPSVPGALICYTEWHGGDQGTQTSVAGTVYPITPPPPAPVPAYAPAPAALPVPPPPTVAAPSPAKAPTPAPAPAPAPAPGTVTTIYGGSNPSSTGPIAGDGLVPGSLSLTGEAVGPLINQATGEVITPQADTPWLLLAAAAAAGLFLLRRRS